MSLHEGVTPAGAHTYQLRVYFEDTDAGGVVYHANYLRFAERARTEALREAGVPHAEMAHQFGLIFMVRRVVMEYLRPARLDDLITVLTETLSVGGATVTLRQSFRSQGFRDAAADLAVMEARLACVRLADGRPARIPDRWRARLTALAGDKTSGSCG